MSDVKVPVSLQSKTLREVMGEVVFAEVFLKYREISHVRTKGSTISAPSETDRLIFADFLLTKSINTTSKNFSVTQSKVLGAIARVTAA